MSKHQDGGTNPSVEDLPEEVTIKGSDVVLPWVHLKNGKLAVDSVSIPVPWGESDDEAVLDKKELREFLEAVGKETIETQRRGGREKPEYMDFGYALEITLGTLSPKEREIFFQVALDESNNLKPEFYNFLKELYERKPELSGLVQEDAWQEDTHIHTSSPERNIEHAVDWIHEVDKDCGVVTPSTESAWLDCLINRVK